MPLKPIQRRTRRQSKGNISADLHAFDKKFYSDGVSSIAGVDEAGRGPLAGPVVASAVILPADVQIEGLRDSKKLTPKKREVLFEKIMESSISWGVGVVSPAEIDEMNILRASLKAMDIAVSGLLVSPELLLVDGPFEIAQKIPQRAIKKGDDLSLSIAAASVIAKVTRDRMMCDLEKVYPNFSFSVHKGYGTKLHFRELREFGPTPVHRRSFLKEAINDKR